MNVPLKKSRGRDKVKDDFCNDESVEIVEFSEGEAKIEGTLLKSFSFDSDDELVEAPIISPASSIAATEAFNLSENSNKLTDNNPTEETNIDHRTLKANPNGRTPSVNGEIYDMVRTYTLRRSTVRILSKIKAIHIDDNVYLNTIVDEAIRHYYDYLKNLDT